MTRALQYAAESLQDIEAAAARYSTARQGLGGEFADAIETLMQSTLATPFMFPVLYGNLRQAKMRRFPYVICYRVYESVVLVVGVLPVRRDPQAIAEILATR